MMLLVDADGTRMRLRLGLLLLLLLLPLLMMTVVMVHGHGVCANWDGCSGRWMIVDERVNENESERDFCCCAGVGLVTWR